MSLFLGTTLAAAAGLRAFLPLFLLGVLERAQVLAPFSIGETFQWLTSDIAILTLGIATVVEVTADKFPAVDSALDTVMTFVRPAAGAVSVFAIVGSQDPTLGYVSGIVLAGGATLPVHMGKGFLRLGSHATTGGMGSPALSVFEDATAASAITFSAFIPPLACLFGIASIGFIFWMVRKIRKARKKRAAT